MRPVSAEFLNALRGSHRIVSRARILRSFQTGVDPDGVEVPIVDGDISQDASADVRATADLTVAGAWPDNPRDYLTPYGNEIFLERGVVFGNGDIEYVSQGYFRMYTIEQSETPAGTLRIAARDRMSGIIDARLEYPIQFGIGVTIASTISFLVRQVYPDATIEYDFDAAAIQFESPYIAEKDRFGFIDDVVKSQGKVWYWDYRGVLRIEDPPQKRHPVWSVTHGEDGVLVKMQRALDRDGVYNAVVASGETPGEHEPVQAIARDNNPQSPTYYYGRFGPVPRFYVSPFITTYPQARSAALSMLEQETGLPYNVDFASVPNPALEVLDPVRVTYSNGAPAEVHTITNLSTPLTPQQTMAAQTREQTRTIPEVL